MNKYKVSIISSNDLKKLDKDKINQIKKYAYIEHQKFMDKRIQDINYEYNVYYTAMTQPKKLPKKSLSKIIYNPYLYLEAKILYEANKTAFPFKELNEKNLFICSGIFPDDESFLERLKKSNYFDFFAEIVDTINYFDKKYENDEKQINFQKIMYFNKLKKQNENQINLISKYFFDNHKITDINIVLNKLIQLSFFNPELYNEYRESQAPKENKKVLKI